MHAASQLVMSVYDGLPGVGEWGMGVCPCPYIIDGSNLLLIWSMLALPANLLFAAHTPFMHGLQAYTDTEIALMLTLNECISMFAPQSVACLALPCLTPAAGSQASQEDQPPGVP